MTKKIFRSVFFTAMTVLIACVFIIMGFLYDYFTIVQKNQLKEELSLAANGVQSGGVEYLSSLKSDVRLTWIASDGSVLFDSEKDAQVMENHLDREEVKEALEDGFGESSRFSSTFTEKMYYFAQKLSDGTVLRVSENKASVLSLFVSMAQPIALIILFALILSLLLASRLSRRIVEPLATLDFEHPLENKVYEEFTPVLYHIQDLQNQINSQISELAARKNEFYAVIENMNEGLVLLNGDGVILSINPAAEKFFSGNGEYVGKSFCFIEKDKEIQCLPSRAEKEGGAQCEVCRDGREYQLNASPICRGKENHGVVLLIFDITEKCFAERNRREFTANVSHELKTPLHSIMGRAELIENGMVKSEDIPSFASYIRTEASRLVALIEDIIRLSRLDEKDEMPKEQLDLYELVCEEAESLSHAAKERHVTIKTEGEHATVTGVKQLLHEIVYNLCENAVKYNKEGGSVTISVKKEDEHTVLSVSDTGIGIPPEHQSRVFERFYRVDKSHSKETGGTGLGLSIVKHAVEYMGGEINLESGEDIGTTVTIRL